MAFAWAPSSGLGLAEIGSAYQVESARIRLRSIAVALSASSRARVALGGPDESFVHNGIGDDIAVGDPRISHRTLGVDASNERAPSLPLKP